MPIKISPLEQVLISQQQWMWCDVFDIFKVKCQGMSLKCSNLMDQKEMKVLLDTGSPACLRAPRQVASSKPVR